VPNAYISGTGMYVPPRVVTNDDLATVYGIDTTHEWIHQRSGISERRFAEEGIGSSDLALPAAQMAIEDAGITKNDLDLIIFATLSPEHQFPGSACYLQEKLGLCTGDSPKFVACLDIRNQCSGFVYGLSIAAAQVQAGAARHVLMVGAEVHSAGLDLSTRGRQVASLFGDGAGAVVVSATDEDRGVRGWWLGADGRYADNLTQKIFNTRNRPLIRTDAEGNGVVPAEELWPHMDGRIVFKHAVERMIMVLMQACWEKGLTPNDIDMFFFHQANMRINQFVQQQLQIPDEKVVHNIERFGNTTAATIPLLLAEAQRNGKLKRGMKVAMVAFGAGFTWGAAIVDW
jgi:3-oxoacyl-[acyl-carrier-protein] synthase-3